MMPATTQNKTLANFTVTNLAGKTVALDTYLGKVVLIVNTASTCGFTPQYQGLQSIYALYEARGLVVLAFPCNQFGGQESGNAEQIGALCETRFAVKFPIMAKIEVNGINADPLYEWLKESKTGFLGTPAIKWNFTKFLIAKDGTVFKRYSSYTKPAALAADIEHLLTV
jgi:glutathione peroxidase